MKHLLFPAVAALFLLACQSKPTSDPADTISTTKNSSDTIMDSARADNAHSANNSLDWKGLYKGVLPCADCEGIETSIILNADNTYLLQTKYLGKGDAPAVEKTGSFTWNAAGNTVIFANIENAPNQYFVAENKLIQLDMAGNKIEGKLATKYFLAKQ